MKKASLKLFGKEGLKKEFKKFDFKSLLKRFEEKTAKTLPEKKGEVKQMELL